MEIFEIMVEYIHIWNIDGIMMEWNNDGTMVEQVYWIVWY